MDLVGVSFNEWELFGVEVLIIKVGLWFGKVSSISHEEGNKKRNKKNGGFGGY